MYAHGEVPVRTLEDVEEAVRLAAEGALRAPWLWPAAFEEALVRLSQGEQDREEVLRIGLTEAVGYDPNWDESSRRSGL